MKLNKLIYVYYKILVEIFTFLLNGCERRFFKDIIIIHISRKFLYFYDSVNFIISLL